MMFVMPTLYDTLGVPADATSEQIERAWRDRIALYHPDRLGTLPAGARMVAEAECRAVNKARDVLIDPCRRADYDSEQRIEQPTAPQEGWGNATPGWRPPMGWPPAQPGPTWPVSDRGPGWNPDPTSRQPAPTEPPIDPAAGRSPRTLVGRLAAGALRAVLRPATGRAHTATVATVLLTLRLVAVAAAQVLPGATRAHGVDVLLDATFTTFVVTGGTVVALRGVARVAKPIPPSLVTAGFVVLLVVTGWPVQGWVAVGLIATLCLSTWRKGVLLSSGPVAWWWLHRHRDRPGR